MASSGDDSSVSQPSKSASREISVCRIDWLDRDRVDTWPNKVSHRRLPLAFGHGRQDAGRHVRIRSVLTEHAGLIYYALTFLLDLATLGLGFSLPTLLLGHHTLERSRLVAFGPLDLGTIDQNFFLFDFYFLRAGAAVCILAVADAGKGGRDRRGWRRGNLADIGEAHDLPAFFGRYRKHELVPLRSAKVNLFAVDLCDLGAFEA